LLFKEQRYKIESNSQHNVHWYISNQSCCSKSKDTKLKAIHNQQTSSLETLKVVVQRAKIQNWKQFTTGNTLLCLTCSLLFKEQRYKIESNSQPTYIKSRHTKGCCSKSKDTKLKAIHNYLKTTGQNWDVVVQRAKIQNWKQFTTGLSERESSESCCSKSKDTKLKAIHNYKVALENNNEVVVQRAKIQNWKQFTTLLISSTDTNMLLFKEQRYKIESNSQPVVNIDGKAISCCSKSKDTKLKAIHNLHTCVYKLLRVVVQRAKIQNWKQFTTSFIIVSSSSKLLFKEQRYKIESNSQHIVRYRPAGAGCCSKSKDTKLKAIHNLYILVLICIFVVVQRAKIQNWKQFTTILLLSFSSFLLLFKEQRYKIESNSQHLIERCFIVNSCCSKSKDTKLKAIHNNVITDNILYIVVVQRAKIQNWKQFTTYLSDLPTISGLLFKEQRYKIESNSQQHLFWIYHLTSCCSKSKDTKLKAIHNSSVIAPKAFWLLFKEQRYKIESNSQLPYI